MTRSEMKEKSIRLMNQAEQVRQRFLVKGVDVANRASSAFLTAKDGKKRQALRKFVKSLAGN